MKRRMAVSGLVGLLCVAVIVPAASANLLSNGGFEVGTTAEWQQVTSVGFGQIALGLNERRTGKVGLKLNPAPAGCTQACQLGFTQALDNGAVTGRRLDFSGWFRTNSGDRGLAVRISMLARDGQLAKCEAQLPGGGSGWQELTLRCAAPQIVYSARLEFTTTGTSGTVSVDDLALTATGNGPGFAIEMEQLSTAPIPADAAIVMVSTRHHTSGAFGVVNPEVYVAAADGGDVSRVTTAFWGRDRVAVAPDRNYLAVVRFTEDIDKDRRYTSLVDPQALWVVDLAAGEERQVTPDWYWSGVGGVDWTPDGEWIVFSMLTGRTASVYRIRPDGSDLERLSPDESWASDVAVSPDGGWVAYHRRERNLDGTFAQRGEIWMMRIDGSDNRQVSNAGGLAPGSQQGSPVGDYEPSFDPEQTALVLSCNNPASGGWDLVRVNLDGSGRTTLIYGTPGAQNRAPDWGENDAILFTLWRTGVAPYQGPATVPVSGGPPTYLDPGHEDPSDGGVWARWIPPAPEPSYPRARRIRRAGGGS